MISNEEAAQPREERGEQKQEEKRTTREKYFEAPRAETATTGGQVTLLYLQI